MARPTVLSLLAADRVARNRSDGRFDIFGVFHALMLELPNRLTFVVYYSLTDVHAPCDLGIYLYAPDESRIAGGLVRVGICDPIAIVQSMAQFDVQIVAAGTYRLRLECSGDVLAERPILIGSTVAAGQGIEQKAAERAPVVEQ